MAATTQTNVLLIAPELSGIAAEVWMLILADVALEVPSSVFGSRQEQAQRYMAAHYLTLIAASNKQTAGPISSESVGQVSLSYAAANYRDRSRYDETVYGRQFIQIRKSCVIGFQVYTP